MTRLLLLLLVACGPKKAPEPAVTPVAAPAPPVDPLAARPEVPPPAPFTPPTAATAALSNGVPLWVIEQPSLPLVSLVIRVPGGSAVDPVGGEGTAALSDRLMTKGAGKRDAEAFAAALGQLGATVDVSTTRTSSQLTLSVKRDKLEPALDLVADAVLRPTYAAAEVTRERDLLLSELAADQDDPRAVAERVGWSLWFGADHPYGRPVTGTEAGVRTLDRDRVKGYHRVAWTATGAQITVAGALTVAEAQALLEPRLGAPWKRAKALPSEVPAAPARGGGPIYVVDKPGSAQTMFYVMFPGVGAADPARAATEAGTIVLGGTFTSRLNALLREKRGYTYGVRAATQVLPDQGVLTIATRIRTDATAAAMTDLVAELARLQAGITDEELGKARGAHRQDIVESLQARDATAATYAWHQAMGLGPDGPASELGAMTATDLAAVQAAMARYRKEGAVFLLVGDKAAIEAPLAEAGFGKIEAVAPR